MKKGTALVLGFAALMLGALVYTTMGNQEHRVEVCITYYGRKACRTASARTKETAQRTAAELACSGMEGDMRDRINCPNTPPDSVTWK